MKCASGGRGTRNQLTDKKKKGPVEPKKEEEEDKLERFFCHLYGFHNPVPNAPVFVPAELLPRYAINFVPAVSALPVSPKTVVPISVATASPVPVSNYASNLVAASSDISSSYSIVSSA